MQARIEALREQLRTEQLDGLLVTGASNRRYLTGFTGTAGVALVTLEKAILITDFRYTDQARNQASAFEVIQFDVSFVEQIAIECEKLGVKKLAFEQDHMTFTNFTAYKDKVQAELIPVSGYIENIRMVKSAEEIQIIRKAVEIADATFSHILNFIKPGLTEKDVANEMEMFMRASGADCSSFDTIVASGHRGALPHGVATTKVIEQGDMVTLDFGALYRGYRSDMTRTVAVGHPLAQLKEVYEIVLEAELQTIAMLKPGVACKDVDLFAHGYVEQNGYGFGHGTGHSLGVDLHEQPFFSTKSENELVEGMIMTVEPGIYIPCVGGVRIEDDVLITATGCEVLTRSPKELILL
ncbi:Xaa-Pro peptidase family protein [Paenibacillus sp. N1-5-1-14]|uniref:M24 family metallopeptidase n=1 Tax=Paenibacillus radicibacter TaxID=2972488 RepID=UPI0021599FB1|nr:Xaa-Pro peptidase family protein [Paenibacillus radicibacter]MCR8644775.1 Xaa-Pro peptidase family protein [Paenibacillus radicibacter]